MTTENKVFTISSDIVTQVDKEMTDRIKNHVKEYIYPTLTEMQKELISVDHIVKLYKATSDECFFNLLTDTYYNIENEYVDMDELDKHVEKMIKIIKRIKNRSDIRDNVMKPSLSSLRDNNDDTRMKLKIDTDIYGDLVEFYSDELKEINGKLRKRLIINYVYSLYMNCDMRPYVVVEYGNDERIKRMKEAMRKLTPIIKEIIKTEA